MNKCRVIFKANEEVVVVYPAPKAKREDETEAEFYERVMAKAVAGTDLEGLPFDDVNPATLPDRKHRDKWRGTKAQGLRVDHSVVTQADKRKALDDEIDAELAEATPDTAKAMRLQRKLDKKDY